MFGFRAIREGQRAAVWKRNGRVVYVDGPARVFAIGREFSLLTRHRAEPAEYLAVQYRDGRLEHIPGPACVWFDPVEHESVVARRAVGIDANEAIVVYRQEEAGIQRRLVHGPALYIPSENEWIHQFQWHGADPNCPNRKVPGALRFTKLRVIPDQMYFDVEDVRTADDALLVVKLMIFFELQSVEKMLDATHDPVADFINAVTADIIDFAAALSFDRFKDRTECLNDLATYRQLLQRAERTGYHIGKVVYRGYHASAKLQAMHDNAIETRTQLRLQGETERQSQELEDFRIEKQLERVEKQQEMERGAVEHKNRLALLTQEEELKRKRRIHEEALEEKRAAAELELETEARHARERLARRQESEELKLRVRARAVDLEVARRKTLDAQQASFLREVKQLDVDLTRYLVARYRNPDRLIRIDSGAPPQLHLHDPE